MLDTKAMQRSPLAATCGDEGFRDAVGGNDVGAPDLLPGSVVDRAEVLLPAEDPGIVDEQVDGLGRERGGEGADGGGFGDVQRVRFRITALESACQLLRPRRVAAAGVHPPSVGGTGARELEADSPARAGNQNARHARILLS